MGAFPIDSMIQIKVVLGALCIIGLYSVLYKENKLYRFFEHMFLGLAAGYSLVALWKETLFEQWWIPMTGRLTETGEVDTPGFWLFALLLPIGLMAYTVFSPKHNWMSRIPIGMILGLWSGQQIQIFWNKFGPQILNSIKPIVPTNTSSFVQEPAYTFENGAVVARENAGVILAQIHMSEVINNVIFLVVLLSAMGYFLFSIDLRGRAATGFNKLGRWMLMIGFGAIFGSTVMARFALVIDRISFVLIDTVQAFSR
jgi:hypothetical protein